MRTVSQARHALRSASNASLTQPTSAADSVVADLSNPPGASVRPNIQSLLRPSPSHKRAHDSMSGKPGRSASSQRLTVCTARHVNEAT
jgi:hypothetical protein